MLSLSFFGLTIVGFCSILSDEFNYMIFQVGPSNDGHENGELKTILPSSCLSEVHSHATAEFKRPIHTL